MGCIGDLEGIVQGPREEEHCEVALESEGQETLCGTVWLDSLSCAVPRR